MPAFCIADAQYFGIFYDILSPNFIAGDIMMSFDRASALIERMKSGETIKNLSFKAALIALATLSMPVITSASSLHQYIGFGDSTLDSGYFRYHTTGSSAIDAAIATAVNNGDTGAFVGNGVMNSVILAEKFGLNATPSDNGGTNYAIGGAETSITFGQKLSTIVQIQNYLTSVHGIANPEALYVIATGSNDLHDVQVSAPGWLNAQASALASQVGALQAAGARIILVTNPYNSAIYAGLGGDITSGNAAAYATSLAYGNTIWSSLTGKGVNFIPVDEDSVFRFVVKNPTLFGFTALSVLPSNSIAYNTSALLSAPMSASYLNSYLFVDALHMTTAGQRIVADYEYSLLLAPSEISLAAESAVQTGLAHVASIQGHLDFSDQHREDKRLSAWFSAGANNLSLNNSNWFPSTAGVPYGSTMGMDYQINSKLVLGAAISAGGQVQQFSTDGHVCQADESLSIYSAYNKGMFWVDAITSFGLFQDHIYRPVTLGIFTDNNNGSTAGHSLSLSVRAGSTFNLGDVITGPIAGVVLQRVILDEYTESGYSGVTALSFGPQTRDALISQLGWQGSLNLGKGQLFGKIGWNHDWAAKNREITVSITSAVAAPYTTDAAPAASDWGTASLGFSHNLCSNVKLQSTASTMFVNPQVLMYGGELGLNVIF